MCCDIANNYVNFYPHEFDSYVVLVPSVRNKFRLHHIYHPSTFWFGFVAIVLFTVIWIFFKCALYKRTEIATMDYENVILEVLGLCLMTKGVKNPKFISERILVTFILFFATVMSIIEAAIIYDDFVKKVEVTEINTLKELENSDYQILMTADAKVLMEFGNFRKKLQNKFILAENDDVIYNISIGDTSQAYALRRSRASSLLQSYSLHKDGQNIFHIVKEPLCESFFFF